MSNATQVFGAALAALESELDWARLGNSYCEGDGSEFFDDELRVRVLETGLRLADDVGRALEGCTRKRSLYLGAAVAELAPVLAERLVLEREVLWLNLDNDETLELTRALRAVGEKLGVELPRPSNGALEQVEPASCDHLWIVSVLTDPDMFPALHDELYERAGSELATGRGDLSDDRRRADSLAKALLARAAAPCVLTTTDEELVVLARLAHRRELELDVPRDGRPSAIVGDLVRVCRLSSRARPKRSRAR